MIRTLAAALVTSTCIVAFATPAAAQTRQYTIPAGSLKSALESYVRQSGRQVVYRADEVRSARSPGVRGSMSAEAALASLLADSGFTTRVDGNLIAIVKAGNDRTDSGFLKTAYDTEESQADIVVTGSNIRGGNPESPIITLTRRDIDSSGYSTAGDVIKSIPQSSSGGQNFNVRGSSNPTSNGNYSAISSANLRGLGSDATLTLLNGRRLAYGGLFNAIDISAIPFAVIERVEVLTDGSSSVYGSDAVGGVVNFVLLKKFDGALTTLRNGVSTRGDGTERQASQVVGTSWSSGSILGSYEYYRQNPIFSSDRDFSRLAPSPNSIIPEQRKHSVFASVNQKVLGDLTISASGTYSSRAIDNDASTSAAITHIESRERQYGVSSQIEWTPGPWIGRLSLDLAGDNQSSNLPSTRRSNGSVSPFSLDLTSKMNNFETLFSGPVFSLPGGSVKAALGGGRREERFSYQAAPVSSSSIYGGARSIWYGYGEIRIPFVSESNKLPFISALELSASARFEEYSDFGNNFSPKVGIFYKPIDDIKLRGTWGRSFKAPMLTQYLSPRLLTIYPASIFVSGVPSGTVIAIRGGGGQDLQPEKAETLSVGVDYSPKWMPGFRVSSTYFRILYNGRISNPISSVAGAFTNPVFAPYIEKNPSSSRYSEIFNAADIYQNLAGSFTPSQVLGIYYAQWQNVYRQRISGFDLDATYAFALDGMRFNLFANAAFLTIKQQNLPTLPEATISGTIFNPLKFRARGGLQIEKGLVGGSLIANHMGPEIDNSNNFNSASSAKNIPVSSMTTIDAQVSFGNLDQSDRSSGFRLTFSIQNILDAKPPYISPTSGTTNNPGFGYDTANYTGIGRYFSVTASKRW